jgi:hypothetical protein
MLVLYFSATLQIKFDSKTLRPVPFSVRIFRSKVTSFLSVFLQTSLLYSVLLPYGYAIAPQRPIHNLVDLYYWGNIVNAFLMASLTSLVLDGMYPTRLTCALLGVSSLRLLSQTAFLRSSWRFWPWLAHIYLYRHDS